MAKKEKKFKGTKELLYIDRFPAETWALFITCWGLTLIAASCFTPRWRVDDYGTQPLEDKWIFAGFTSKTYGLLQIIGASTQSWRIVAQTTCDYMTYAAITSGVSIIVSAGESWSSADSATEAYDGTSDAITNTIDSLGFMGHMQVRCDEYTKMSTTSSIVLSFSALIVIMSTMALMFSVMSKRRKTGGIIFGVNIVGGVFGLCCNIAWAVTTDVAFKRIGESAWYPYPSLGIGYYMHLWGSLSVICATCLYGVLVIPQTLAYDAVQEKIDKKEEKLARLRNAAEQEEMMINAMQQQPQQFGAPMQQQQPQYFPPPPGGFQQGGFQQNGFQQGGFQQGGFQQGPPQFQGGFAGDPNAAGQQQGSPQDPYYGGPARMPALPGQG